MTKYEENKIEFQKSLSRYKDCWQEQYESGYMPPERAKQYIKDLEDFNTTIEALDKAQKYDELMTAKPIYDDELKDVRACLNCGSGEYLENFDGNENEFCGQCGQKIKRLE